MNSEIVKGKNGQISSKRVAGLGCIIYAALLPSVTFVLSGFVDIPPNVQVVSLQFLAVGAGLLTAGVLEKKDNNK